MSMTDYEVLFKDSIDSARNNIRGIMQISMLKMTLAENGKDIHVAYKEDSDKKGWLPRPVLLAKTSAWKHYFKNESTAFAPTKILNHRPIKVINIFYLRLSLSIHFVRSLS